MVVREHRAVEITRDFDAPRESVFRMWTDAKKVAKWWGPEGSTNVLCEVDPRPGGAIRIDDRGPDGLVYSLTGTFSKVSAPELLVFRGASPGAGKWAPWEALNTVTFEELGPRKTRVRVTVQVVMAEQAQRESLEQGFRGGWAESLEKLQRALR